MKNPRIKSPNLHDAADWERRDYRIGPLRLIYWGMWRNVPLWDVRLSIKHGFLMFGAWEVRFK